MKKQYITPLQFVVNFQGMGIIAASAQISTNDDGTPSGSGFGNVTGDDGDAWGGAAVKEHSIWDD